MSLIIDGVEIPATSTITYNGTAISDIICAGVKVWTMRRDPVNFAYTGGIQSYTIPTTGLYKLEVWGASGGDAECYKGNGYGGAGGYSYGYALLTAGDTLYVVVGGRGGNGVGAGGGAGFNGGGTTANNQEWYSGCGGGGGGATHIATRSGTLAALGSTSGLLIVAGGGGGGSAQKYNDGSSHGGSGGGLNGGDASNGQYSWLGSGATQTGTGRSQLYWGADGGFGYGGPSGHYAGGAGGGLYGGRGGGQSNAGGGGSGYIGGVPAITYNGTAYSPSTTNGANSGNGRASILLVG